MHKSLLIGLSLALATVSPLAGESRAVAASAPVDVFVPGTEGYYRYRIPSVIRASNGDLLAFCEGRRNSGDDHGDIDVVMKRSRDGGRTWGSLQVVWDDGKNSCGNPCAVLDTATGELWLLLSHNLGLDREEAIMKGQAKGTRTVWVTSSRDHGVTWSQPVQITKQAKDPSWGWYATGPGIGIQLQAGPHAGRLVIPCNHSYLDAESTKPRYGAHVIFSDDHGRSWRRGGAIRYDVNESQVAELFDGRGTLLINMRSYSGKKLRASAISSDGGESWTEATAEPALVDSVCQGSILRHPSGLLLFSNPSSPKARTNLTVHSSGDNGRTWSPLVVLAPGPSAYSCLVALARDEAGCLYERGREDRDERISFTRFQVPVQ